MSQNWTEESNTLNLKKLKREIAQLDDKSCLEELLQLQLSEYEMLESMFSNPGELRVDDYSVLADIHDYLNGRTSAVPRRLNYIINLNLDDHKLEVCINLPLTYPNLEPDIFLRNDDLNRAQQSALNSDLRNYILTLQKGDICIFLVISWLRENAPKYFSKTEELNSHEHKEIKSPKQENSFCRLWIYSHHIYDKIKRKEILYLAQDFKLTGFCLPGRPGIICLEGYSSDCEELWQKIKCMNWKKIMVKKIEKIKLESAQIENLRKFSDFKEISFESGSNKKHDFHMDFGEFYKYLTNHHCEYIFKDYFGIDGNNKFSKS